MLLLLTVKAKTKAQLQMAVYQIGSMATDMKKYYNGLGLISSILKY